MLFTVYTILVYMQNIIIVTTLCTDGVILRACDFLPIQHGDLVGTLDIIILYSFVTVISIFTTYLTVTQLVHIVPYLCIMSCVLLFMNNCIARSTL